MARHTRDGAIQFFLGPLGEVTQVRAEDESALGRHRRSSLPELPRERPDAPTAMVPAAASRDSKPSAIKVPLGAHIADSAIVVLIAAVVGALAAIGYTTTRPAADSVDMSIYVSTTFRQQVNYLEASSAAVSRVSSYAALLRSDGFARRVIEARHLRTSPRDLAGRITVRVPTGSSILDVRVTNRSAAASSALANIVFMEFQELVGEIETPLSGGAAAATATLVQTPYRVTVSRTDIAVRAALRGSSVAVIIAAVAVALRIWFTFGLFGALRRPARRHLGAVLDRRLTSPMIVTLAGLLAVLGMAYPISVAITALLGAVTIILLICLVSVRATWVVFFFAICANGLLFNVGSITLRPEYFAAPVLVLSLAWSHRGRVHQPHGLPLILLGLTGWFGASVTSSLLAATEPLASLRMCIQLGAALLVFVPMIRMIDSARFCVVSGTYVLAAISTVALVLWIPDPSSRLAGLAFEYNVMGALCVGWLAVVYFCHEAGMRLPGLVRVALIPITLALLLTTTRTAWISLALVVTVYLLRNVARRPTLAATAAVAVVCLYGAAATLAPTDDENSVLWRATHLADLGSGTGEYRLAMWQQAIDEIGVRNLSSLIGTGLNSFSQHHLIDATGVSAPYLSSLWIGVVYDSGWVGAAFFMLFLAGIVASIERKWAALPLGFSLALCASLTNIIWFAFPWVFFALVVIADREARARSLQITALRPGVVAKTRELADR